MIDFAKMMPLNHNTQYMLITLAIHRWTPYVYSASYPPEPGFLPLPTLRGREAMTYLTFIIEHYDSLPDITAFVHAGATQWHNDILGAYTTSILDNLRTESVNRLGYANLRCRPEPGCPTSVNIFEPSVEDIKSKDARFYFPEIYMELFGVTKEQVPEHVGHTCCAQFAVSRERIRARPRKDYERMRLWITDSSVNVTDSHGVGWVFEMVWHVVFGMEPIYCPSLQQCRCDLFGWCGADCPDRYKPLVRGAHPWLGMKLGEKLGNSHAYGGENV